MWSYFTSHTRSIRSGSHDRSLPGAPAALSAGHARRGLSAARFGPLAPGMIVERAAAQRLELRRQLPAHGHRERRSHADVVQPLLVVIQPEQKRAHAARSLPALCQRKPATTQSAVRACFTLIIARLPGWYVPPAGFAITPSSPAPSNRDSHSAATFGVARHRASDESAAATPASSCSSRARRSLCAMPRRSCPSAARRSNATNAAGVSFGKLRDARRRRMEPQLKGVEVEAPWRRDHDLAVDDAAVRAGGRANIVVELGKVPVERPQVAALNEDVAAAAEDDGAKPVPLRLVQKVAGRHLGRELGEHRLDGRSDGKLRGIGHAYSVARRPDILRPEAAPGGSSHRRNLRAVPPLLRGPVARAMPTAAKSARCAACSRPSSR